MQTIGDVPLILRREIEALMVAPFLEAFAEELGEERMREIAVGVMQVIATKAGQDMAKLVPENTLDQFMENIHPRFSCGVQEYEVLEADNNRVRMNITYCPYVEMYERINLKEYGTLLSCERDPYLFSGYNEKLDFHRTQTLMEGGSCCDFCMTMKNCD